MTATNHALTGATIGILIGKPFVAIPLALASHFICDALPHFGTGLPTNRVLKSRGFRNYLLVEAVICFLIVVGLALLQPQNWLLAAVCAFVAAAPDLVSSRRYITIRRGRKFSPNLYEKFAGKIQWFERPIGAVVEAAWFVAAVIILVPFLR